MEINFKTLDYSIREGEDATRTTSITMQFRKAQNPFTLLLSPVSIDDAITHYSLGDFINPNAIAEINKATPGTNHYTVFIQQEL